jgi:phage terminase large subunit-like protein
MPSIPIVSGGSQPVFATDTLNGPQLAANTTYAPAGTPTNFMGPKLDFFGVDLGADPSAQAGVNGAIQTILQTIQQTATIAIYQVAATGNATNLSLAVYPTAAYTAATLQAAIQALGANVAGTGYDASGATVTNVGFRLATTATSAS